MRKEEFEVLNTIPISVNAQLGDPFQPTQWSNTRWKLERLEEVSYEGPVALITKSVLTKDQIEFIERSNLDLFIFMSITGLNENKNVSFTEVKDNYLKVCSTRKPTIIFIRPIIPGYNDNVSTIKPIIEMAAEGSKTIIVRGYKDIFKLDGSTFLDQSFLNILNEICDKYGVNKYRKTALYVASVRKKHFLNGANMQIGVEILQKMGYPVEIENETVILPRYNCTQGDLNFIRMLTGKIVDKNLNCKDAVMTIRKNGQMLDCSSSWFGWARRVPCSINCWYCISKVEGLNKHKEINLGCIPTELL